MSAENIRASSDSLAGTIAIGKDFNCSAANRIHLPPLIDQKKTLTYVLTGGPEMDLVLSTEVQTIIAPYGAKLKGPVQVESITTWHRAGH